MALKPMPCRTACLLTRTCSREDSGLIRTMVLAVAAVRGIGGAVRIAGGALLGADHFALQVVDALDGGAFLHDNHLYAVGVGVGEVHVFLSLVVDGETRHAGHTPYLDNPSEFNAALEGFLRGM